MHCDQPAQLLQSLTRHESLLIRQCCSLDHCVEAVAHANSILNQQCGRLAKDAGREQLILNEQESTPKNRFKSRNRTDISRIAAASEHVDQNKSGIGPWRTRIISLQAGVDGHSQSLKEVMHRLGLLSQSPWNMHRQIYEKQQSLLRQSFQKFVNSARGDTSTQPGMRGSARPMQDKKVEVLSEIEIFYAIRAKAAELEDQCIQSGQCRDARSAVASLEHLVLLHKDTVAGRSAGLIPKADLRRWRTRALRCMGVHSTEGTSAASFPGSPVGDYIRPAELLTAVNGFGATAVYQQMKLVHSLQSRIGSSADWCTATLPGILWLPSEALDMMVTEEDVVDKESCTGTPARNQEPISVLAAAPALARAWLASLFQMQHLVAEVHMLHTTAPDILRDSADIVRELQTRCDEASQSRVAWLARLLHSLLLPTSRCSLSIGKLCKGRQTTPMKLKI